VAADVDWKEEEGMVMVTVTKKHDGWGGVGVDFSCVVCQLSLSKQSRRVFCWF
jgi:hypothetical protein